MTATATNAAVSKKINALEATRAALAAQLKAAKEGGKRAAWEKKTKARNPQLIVGSLRPATEADALKLGHTHGWVCEIKCARCSTKRLINKQDAFQVKHCEDCKGEARKAAAKARRETAKLAGQTPEKLNASIELLKKQLADLS